MRDLHPATQPPLLYRGRPSFVPSRPSLEVGKTWQDGEGLLGSTGRQTAFLAQEELLPASPEDAAPAQSRFPFAVALPPTAPGTLLSQDKARNGKLKLKYQIAYSVKAELEMEGGLRKLSERLPFTVLEPSQLSLPTFLVPPFGGGSITQIEGTSPPSSLSPTRRKRSRSSTRDSCGDTGWFDWG